MRSPWLTWRIQGTSGMELLSFCSGKSGLLRQTVFAVPGGPGPALVRESHSSRQRGIWPSAKVRAVRATESSRRMYHPTVARYFL